MRIPARTEFVVTEWVRLLTVPKLRFGVFDRGFRIAAEKETNQHQKLENVEIVLLERSEFGTRNGEAPSGKIIVTETIVSRNKSEIR